MKGCPRPQCLRRGFAEALAIFHRETPELPEACLERTLLHRGALRVAFAQQAPGFLETPGFEELGRGESADCAKGKRWNTYLAVRCYNDAAIKMSLEAGAMSIEHGNLLTDETMKLLAEKGAFLSTQTTNLRADLFDCH